MKNYIKDRPHKVALQDRWLTKTVTVNDRTVKSVFCDHCVLRPPVIHEPICWNEGVVANDGFVVMYRCQKQLPRGAVLRFSKILCF